MKKISLKELRMLIQTTKEDLSEKKYLLQSNSSLIEHISDNDKKFVISNDFDFNKELEEYNKLTSNLVKYEILAQEYNTTIKVEGKSLTAIIKELQSLREELNFYDKLISKNPYKKRMDVSNSGTYYYEIATLRFDKESFIEKRAVIRDKIKELEVLLDTANTEPYIPINNL